MKYDNLKEPILAFLRQQAPVSPVLSLSPFGENCGPDLFGVSVVCEIKTSDELDDAKMSNYWSYWKSQDRREDTRTEILDLIDRHADDIPEAVVAKGFLAIIFGQLHHYCKGCSQPGGWFVFDAVEQFAEHVRSALTYLKDRNEITYSLHVVSGLGFAHIHFSSGAPIESTNPLATVAVIYDTSFLMSDRARILNDLVPRDYKGLVHLRHIVPSAVKAELAKHLKNADSPEKQDYARKARALYAAFLADPNHEDFALDDIPVPTMQERVLGPDSDVDKRLIGLGLKLLAEDCNTLVYLATRDGGIAVEIAHRLTDESCRLFNANAKERFDAFLGRLLEPARQARQIELEEQERARLELEEQERARLEETRRRTEGKVPCQACGALILPSTSERTGGLCMPCSRK